MQVHQQGNPPSAARHQIAPLSALARAAALSDALRAPVQAPLQSAEVWLTSWLSWYLGLTAPSLGVQPRARAPEAPLPMADPQGGLAPPGMAAGAAPVDSSGRAAEAMAAPASNQAAEATPTSAGSQAAESLPAAAPADSSGRAAEEMAAPASNQAPKAAPTPAGSQATDGVPTSTTSDRASGARVLPLLEAAPFGTGAAATCQARWFHAAALLEALALLLGTSMPSAGGQPPPQPPPPPPPPGTAHAQPPPLTRNTYTARVPEGWVSQATLLALGPTSPARLRPAGATARGSGGVAPQEGSFSSSSSGGTGSSTHFVHGKQPAGYVAEVLSAAWVLRAALQPWEARRCARLALRATQVGCMCVMQGGGGCCAAALCAVG